MLDLIVAALLPLAVIGMLIFSRMATWYLREAAYHATLADTLVTMELLARQDPSRREAYDALSEEMFGEATARRHINDSLPWWRKARDAGRPFATRPWPDAVEG